MSKPELKFCPACGPTKYDDCQPEVKRDLAIRCWVVICGNCMLTVIPHVNSEQATIEEWNQLPRKDEY